MATTINAERVLATGQLESLKPNDRLLAEEVAAYIRGVMNLGIVIAPAIPSLEIEAHTTGLPIEEGLIYTKSSHGDRVLIGAIYPPSIRTLLAEEGIEKLTYRPRYGGEGATSAEFGVNFQGGGRLVATMHDAQEGKLGEMKVEYSVLQQRRDRDGHNYGRIEFTLLKDGENWRLSSFGYSDIPTPSKTEPIEGAEEVLQSKPVEPIEIAVLLKSLHAQASKMPTTVGRLTLGQTIPLRTYRNCFTQLPGDKERELVRYKTAWGDAARDFDQAHDDRFSDHVSRVLGALATGATILFAGDK